jgi:hypothetical protein
MKKLFMIVIAVFALALLSSAQTGGYDQGAKPSDKDSGGATLTGCLSGPNSEGLYTLKSGKREVEVGGLDDLSKHVGHEVKLHGSWEKTGGAIGEKGEAGAKGGKESKEESRERHFKVSSIDDVSSSCSSGSSQPNAPPK